MVRSASKYLNEISTWLVLLLAVPSVLFLFNPDLEPYALIGITVGILGLIASSLLRRLGH